MQALDLIQPCYNPAPGWEKKTHRYFEELQQLFPAIPLHLIIVNDGSTQPIAAEAIEYLKAHLAHFTYVSYAVNQGKGYALRQGVAAGHSPLQIFTDIDFPYQLHYIRTMYDHLVAGADIVAGCRDEDYYQHLSWKRWVTSKMSQLLNRLLLRLPNSDTQSGLKGFNARGREIFLRTTINRFLCDAEFLVLGHRTPGIKLEYIPLRLRPGVAFSSMNLQVILQEMGNLIRIALK